jgi:hypothetical protein
MAFASHTHRLEAAPPGEGSKLDEPSRIRLAISPLTSFLKGLARDHTLIRFDARGNGLSDWDVDDVSFDAFLGDLEK